MLSVVTCDAPVTPEVWRAMFRRGAAASFNQITVDGDTSTNDTVLGLASGLAGGQGERRRGCGAWCRDSVQGWVLVVCFG
jgi:N-acetylglutamate synthase/N-acetylornithine aminotransferase